jgi:predicted transcriptional regulator
MIPTCRNVLKGLRSISHSPDVLLTYGDSTHVSPVGVSDMSYDCSKYQNELRSILDKLSEDGYITYEGSKRIFRLTQKGLHPHMIKWEELKSFLFRSFLVPIGVSIVTTLITLWLQGLLL